MKLILLSITVLLFIVFNTTAQTVNFTTPSIVCAHQQFNITNTSTADSTLNSYAWNLCNTPLNTLPNRTNLGSIGGQLNTDAFTAVAEDSGHYYTFTTNYSTGNIIRADFGNSLLNTPTAIGLVSGLGNNLEGIQIARDSGKWIIFTVSTNQLNRIVLGNSLGNSSPVVTNLGNIGNLDWPHDLQLVNENGNWFGFVANRTGNSITRLDFGNSLFNTPTGNSFSFATNLNGPSGVFLKRNTINGNWILFISNLLSDSLTRFNLGNAVSNTPVFMNNVILKDTCSEFRDITIVETCSELKGFGVYKGTNNVIQFEFASNDISSNYINVVKLDSFTSLTSQPHGLTLPVMASATNNDKVIFLTDVGNRLVRLDFPGCSNASLPSYFGFTPPVVSFNTSGNFTISLTVNQGQPNEINICKSITVHACEDGIEKYSSVAVTPDEVKVFDVMGREVYTSPYNLYAANKMGSTMPLATGIYFSVYLKSKKQLSVNKIFVGE